MLCKKKLPGAFTLGSPAHMRPRVPVRSLFLRSSLGLMPSEPSVSARESERDACGVSPLASP